MSAFLIVAGLLLVRAVYRAGWAQLRREADRERARAEVGGRGGPYR